MKLYATVKLDWPPGLGNQSTAVQLAGVIANMPPVPPSFPHALNLPKPPALSTEDTNIYSGSGTSPGRGLVRYRLSENKAKALISVYADEGATHAQTEASTLRMQFHNSLLTANPPNRDTLIKSPIGGSTVWLQIEKAALAGGAAKAGWEVFPARLKIGVAVGEARFGLIHFLTGHANTIGTFLSSATGQEQVYQTGEQKDRALLTTSGLQALLDNNFTADKLRRIWHGGGAKFVLMASDQRKLVVDNQTGGDTHTLTTLYGASEAYGGPSTEIWASQ